MITTPAPGIPLRSTQAAGYVSAEGPSSRQALSRQRTAPSYQEGDNPRRRRLNRKVSSTFDWDRPMRAMSNEQPISLTPPLSVGVPPTPTFERSTTLAGGEERGASRTPALQRQRTLPPPPLQPPTLTRAPTSRKMTRLARLEQEEPEQQPQQAKNVAATPEPVRAAAPTPARILANVGTPDKQSEKDNTTDILIEEYEKKVAALQTQLDTSKSRLSIRADNLKEKTDEAEQLKLDLDETKTAMQKLIASSEAARQQVIDDQKNQTPQSEAQPSVPATQPQPETTTETPSETTSAKKETEAAIIKAEESEETEWGILSKVAIGLGGALTLLTIVFVLISIFSEPKTQKFNAKKRKKK